MNSDVGQSTDVSPVESDCKFALLAVASPGVRATFGTLVLQEGSWFHNVRAKLHTGSDFFTNRAASHRKKREAKIKRDVKRGIREPNEQDPFEIFITVTDIRYTCVAPAFAATTAHKETDTTRSLTKFWVTHMACASSKTLRLSRPICSRALSRQWKEGAWSSSC